MAPPNDRAGRSLPYALRLDAPKSVFERQVDATDRQIDRLVYELCGLSEEEVGIVEEVTKE